MSERTYTKADMPDIEFEGAFVYWDKERKDALEIAEAARAKIEETFPPAPGWFWVTGVDGELFLKEIVE